MLALGTALSGIGYLLAGATPASFCWWRGSWSAGLGSSTQHPLASALVARAFAGPRSMKALGTYNFAGDIGKMSVPAAGALLLLLLPWRQTVIVLGSLGLLAAVAIFILIPRLPATAPAPKKSAKSGAGAVPRFGFPLLLSIGMIDSATRMAFLIFLPFVLTAKGASVQTVGLALTLVFAGGAVGKLVCAFIGARIGPWLPFG